MVVFNGHSPVVLALFATLGTYGVTAAGAALVFFLHGMRAHGLALLNGLACGVMLAATFFSLLLPAVQQYSGGALLPVCGGFLLGAFLLRAADPYVERLCARHACSLQKHNALMVLSVTLHNIPEGLAVGVAFAAAQDGAGLLAAGTLALGIALQNFPEGAAVSLPLAQAGLARWRSFLWGQASGLVEPLSGVLGAVLVLQMQQLLPWALAFAAGAMVYVVCAELLPTGIGAHKNSAVAGTVLGFALMMLLDIAFA